MNQYTFDLIAQHRPEVLERVLRVIRLRGFTVTNMEMALVETQVKLKITVKSDRTFDLHPKTWTSNLRCRLCPTLINFV